MLSLILAKLTLRDVLADIPHDFSALIVYIVLGTFIALVVLGSRNGERKGRADV